MPDIFEMEQAINRRKVRELLQLFEEDVYEVLPYLKENIEWKVPYTAIFSVAHAPGQVGRFRPSMRTPVENLYLINDSVRESRGMGLQAVAHTAILCADQILMRK
jgi:phytoene dehydrogenase-like protein